MFESYIRGVFYYNYSSCHQLHTVALSFLPYAAGKQQLEGKMPKIGHFHFTNRSPRDNLLSGELTIKKFRNPENDLFSGFFSSRRGLKHIPAKKCRVLRKRKILCALNHIWDYNRTVHHLGK